MTMCLPLFSYMIKQTTRQTTSDHKRIVAFTYGKPKSPHAFHFWVFFLLGCPAFEMRDQALWTLLRRDALSLRILAMHITTCDIGHADRSFVVHLFVG